MVSRPYRGHYPPAAYAAAFHIIILLQFILLSLVSIVRSEDITISRLDARWIPCRDDVRRKLWGNFLRAPLNKLHVLVRPSLRRDVRPLPPWRTGTCTRRLNRRPRRSVAQRRKKAQQRVKDAAGLHVRTAVS